MIETPPVVINSACFEFKPIKPSRQDVLTRGTQEQIVANNETWEKRCGAPNETPQ